MIRYIFFFSMILLLGSWGLMAQRNTVNLNEGWQYLEQPVDQPAAALEENGWQDVQLPHTWNVTDVTDMEPGYRRNGSWYKKLLNHEKPSNNERTFLLFEGANISSSVFLNGQLVGSHTGGYIGFEVELTPYLKKGENTLMVFVDNAYNPQIIPSQKSDFFIYGGITRDVWLMKVAPDYIEDVNISTPEVSSKKGKTSVEVLTDITSDNKSKVQLSVIDPDGKVVYNKEKPAQEKVMFDLTVKNPKLWDIDKPHLYTFRVNLIANEKIIDNDEVPFGYRWFEFKKHGGFYLNGKRVLLRGTHRHEEHAGYGAAMPNELHRKDMEAIKSMGANFVRLGHYPQDPEVYKACNELGLLVWDELPWCRGGVGDEEWKKNTKNMLAEIIDRHYNHPSIILWSLGNEIYWLPDFENGGDTVRINDYLRELQSMSKKLDPYRPTAIRKYYAGSHIVDVFSPSIWSGWYSGTYENYEKALEKSMEEYPRFLHAEYGGSSHVGRHTENPITGKGTVNPDEWEEQINQYKVNNIAKNGDWSENYIVDLFDWHLMVSENQEDFVGNAQWAFKDFGTPLRPENDIPYINQKGLMDREGKPKDAYYVFKSYWSDDPFVYIESKTWKDRSGPEGLPREVSIYSNCEKVTLFVNGKEMDTKEKNPEQFPACGLTWPVIFMEGKNELIATGMMNGKKYYDTLTVNYSYQQSANPVGLFLDYKPLDNGNILIEATARDKNGKRCLQYEDKVYFQCLSGGNTIKHQGTPNGSEVISMANGKASIEVIPDMEEKELVMTVLNQDFKGTFLRIPLK